MHLARISVSDLKSDAALVQGKEGIAGVWKMCCRSSRLDRLQHRCSYVAVCAGEGGSYGASMVHGGRHEAD